MRLPRIALFLVLFLALPGRFFAQSVRWDPPGGQLGYNQVSELALVFEECEPDGAPQIPTIDGLNFGRPSQSSETSMVNFKISRRLTLVYPVRPSKRTALRIPDFDVQTDKGVVHVKAASFTVGDATVGSTGLALDDISAAKITLAKTTFWAGEVIPVTYTLSVVKRYFHSLASMVEWQPTPLVAEEWSKPEPSEIMLRGERRIVATQTTRVYAKQAGNYTLKPATQIANLVVGQTGFGLFSTPAVEQRALTTEPVEISIQPLPTAPANFSGAIGQFSVVSKIVPTSPAVGEPVTWTLELAGTGNWPDLGGLPQREVSNDFQVVQPKSKRTMKDNALFEGSLAEDVVLVPTKPGKYTLGPVKFTYFDTASGSYKTITTETVTVNVSPANATPPPLNVPGAPVQFSLNLPPSTAPAATAKPAVPPVPPDNLPRDPLMETRRGFVPFNMRDLAILCAVVAASLPLVAWLTLAAMGSRELDPERRRREARAALAALMPELRRADPARTTLHPQLRQWQRHAAALWEVPHAAPGAPLVYSAVTTRAKEAAGTWSTLWAEADRALHGPNPALPSDWVSRADSALHAVKVPGWPLWSLFSPRHLLPFLFTLALLAPAMVRADGASDAYKRGEFPAAEAAWRQEMSSEPTQWSTRHNLGLALAQQDRWAEATAHWTSAFLLAPRATETRWDLALGLQRSGLAPSELVGLARGDGRYELARFASPGEWQLILVVAALLIAASLILLLLQGYRRAGAWAKLAALAGITIAILLAGIATFSLRSYGQLAHPDVALVWKPSLLRSIPTEADTTQKTSPLSAGSIAVVDRTFLRWSRLNFPGGQTGWVLTEDVIRLYK
ncbi:MAG TPA: BatD family protein [Candidatus Didemnitutus sp.]|nr:BatD family protein [Candidatus Didemnitutus sp.]